MKDEKNPPFLSIKDKTSLPSLLLYYVLKALMDENISIGML